MNLEKSFNQPEQKPRNKLIEEGYKKSEEIHGNRPSISHPLFTKLYPTEEIQEDIEKEKEYKEIFKENENQLKRAQDILEAIMFRRGASYFGPNAHMVLTSGLDDFRNQSDLVLVTENPNNQESDYNAIAVDVTFSNDIAGSANDTTVRKKTSKDKYRKGMFTDIKYFMDKEGDKEVVKSLHQIPRFVIDVGMKTLEDLNGLWLDSDKGRSGEKIAEHEVQFDILKQVIVQARVFAEEARLAHKPQDVVQKLSDFRDQMENVYYDKLDNYLKKSYGREPGLKDPRLSKVVFALKQKYKYAFENLPTSPDKF